MYWQQQDSKQKRRTIETASRVPITSFTTLLPLAIYNIRVYAISISVCCFYILCFAFCSFPLCLATNGGWYL